MTQPTSEPNPSKWRRVVGIAALIYALTAVILALMVQIGGDRYPLGMLLLFAPRHLMVVPGLLLLPLAFAASFRIGALALAGLVTAAFPVANLEVPMPWSTRPSPPLLRLVTYNTDRLQTVAWRLRAHLEEWDADIVLLQACKTETADSAKVMAGLNVHVTPEFCIISKLPLIAVEQMVPQRELAGSVQRHVGRALRFKVPTELGLVTLHAIHLGSPRTALSAATRFDFSQLSSDIERRSSESRTIASWAESQDSLIVVAGDFNLPAGSAILARDWGHLRNAFAEVGLGFGNTMFAGRHAVRIDHVLLSPALAAKSAKVLRGYPSQHQPVLVEFGPKESGR